MKQRIFLSLVCLLLIHCSSQVETDEKSVKKVVTVVEFLLLDENFDKLDSTRQQKTVSKFDTHNNLLEEKNYVRETTFAGGVILNYDEANKIKEDYLLDIRGEISLNLMYESSKNLSTGYRLSENGTKEKSQAKYYDTHNNVIREINFARDKVMSDFHYKYDADDKLIERKGTVGSEPVRNLMTYDSLHNLIEQKAVDPAGVILSIEKFIYERYDANGNWEIRRSISHGVPHSVAFQKVEMR